MAKIDNSKYTVLVVDDEAAVLFTYRMILEQQGYSTVAMPGATQAIKFFENRLPHLLLCDLSLEDNRTGFEVFEAARQRNSVLPCILLTGYASQDAVNRANNDGYSVLFKPIDIEEFLATIANLLRDTYEQAKASGQ